MCRIKTALLIYILIYLGNIQIVSAQSYSNDSVLLELSEITPTTAQPTKVVTPKITTQSKPVIDSISMAVDSNYLSFGFLVPGDPILRSNTVTIRSSSTQPYSLFVRQNHPLKSEQNQIIPDTTCDGGGCNPDVASVWESPLTFGFGYRCENLSICNTDFLTSSHYRPLASLSELENSAPILSTNQSQVEVDVSYKLNISSNQESVPYSNTITYTLIPQL